MGKMKKIIISVIAILFILFTILEGEELIVRFRLANKCAEYNQNNLEFDNVSIDDAKKAIVVSFESGVFYKDKLEVVSYIYNEIFDIIFGNVNGKYYNYSFELRIKKMSGENHMRIINVTNDESYIYMYYDIKDATIGDIANLWPQVSELYVSEFRYESLEEFKGFTELKHFQCYSDIIDFYERKDLEEIMPNCELDWSGKTD